MWLICFLTNTKSSQFVFPKHNLTHQLNVNGTCFSLGDGGAQWQALGWTPWKIIGYQKGPEKWFFIIKLSDELPEKELFIKGQWIILAQELFSWHPLCVEWKPRTKMSAQWLPEEVGVAVLAKLVEDKPVSYLTLAGMLQLKEHTYISKSYRSPASKIELRVGLNK